MEQIVQSWAAVAGLMFIFGMKHGLDADHLITIDGLARYNARSNPRLARQCGVLFSLGHGSVVIGAAAIIGAFGAHWRVPEWVQGFGAWVSIAFLTTLGLVNLIAVMSAPRDQLAPTVGLKSGLFRRFHRTGNPLVIVVIGGLFAVSFDTLSQAFMFAVVGAEHGGWTQGAVLGLSFTLGMMTADGLNGVWISHLLRRADFAARVASRVLGLTIAALSLAIAAFGAAKYLSPAVDGWADGSELMLGIGIIAAVGLSFIVSVRMARVAPARP